jgi:hypothetical protein
MTEAVAMELNYGGGVPARGLTGGGPEVGEKLEGSKAVRLSTLVRVVVVGKVDPHGRPKRRREEEHRRASGRPNRRSKKSSEGWRASQG